MKNNFFVFLIFSWLLIFVNAGGAVVKEHQGTGDLYLSDKLINEYFNYVNQKPNKLPLVFFITEDKKNSYFSIINNDGGGWAGSATILKKKNKCEKEFNQKCNLFSNVRYIVWDNGTNPLKESDSNIESKISKEELILKLKRLGFIIDQNKLAEQKASKEKKLAKEKAAKAKAAKEKKLAKEKAAKAKAAKEKKLAKEKAAKEKKLAKEKATNEKLEKKLSLIPVESDLKKAQNFLNNLQEFIKYYPDELDIVKISEFFILTKPILDGTLNSKLEEDLKLLKEFTNSSEKFLNYYEEIKKNRNNEKLKKIDQAFIDLSTSIKTIKGFMIDYPNSLNLKLWLTNIKVANDVLENPDSYEQLLSTNDNLNKLINKKNELDDATKEALDTTDELKNYLKDNLTTDLAPLIIKQIKFLETATKSEEIKNIIAENLAAKDFILKKIVEPKKLAEEKVAEEKRLAEEEKRKEEERIAEEKRKEEERLAEEKLKEKQRLAEEKLKEKQRLAEEKRKEEDLKLQETYKKYKIDLNNEFQKDIIKLGLNYNFQFDDISFLRNDRIIKISNLRSNELKIGNIELKDFNKNIYNLIKNGFNDNLLNDLFKTKNWFSKLVISNISYKDTKGTLVDIQEFSIDDFELKGYEKYKDEVFNSSLKNDELNYISALLSLNIGNYSVKNLKYKSNLEEYSFDLTEFDNFSLTNIDKSTTVNYRSNDLKNNLSIFYKEANLDNFSLDQKEIVKLLNSINAKNLDLFSSPGTLLNSFSELENINIEDLIVEELNSKRKILSLKNFEISDIEFEKPSNRNQKILSNLEFNVDDLEMVGTDKFYPDFSNYMKKLSYSKIALNTGGKWYWNVNDDEFGLDLNIGLTDAFSLNFTSEYSGLSSDFLNLNSDAMGTYFLTNLKINEAELSLQDKSLRNRLIRMFSLETNKSEAQVKNMAISNIRNYSAEMRQSNLTREYEKSLINFIDGDDEIKFKLKPKTPVSIAEITPYFQNGDIDLLAEKLNLTVGN